MLSELHDYHIPRDEDEAKRARELRGCNDDVRDPARLCFVTSKRLRTFIDPNSNGSPIPDVKDDTRTGPSAPRPVMFPS